MKKRLTALILAASMLLVLPGCGSREELNSSVTPAELSHQVVKAAYPVQVQFPSEDDYEDWEKYYEQWELWREDANQWREGQVDSKVIADFLTAAVPELLTGTQGNEVCSPVNIYMALAMLSEVTTRTPGRRFFRLWVYTAWKKCGRTPRRSGAVPIATTAW